MKKHWKVIVGVLLIIGGVGNVASNFPAFLVGLLGGIALLAWYFYSLKSTTQSNESASTTAPPVDIPKLEFTISVDGFGDDAPESNLDFYRDKLSSKKALSTFTDYIVLDCETTGLSCHTDEIIEIAMVKYINGERAAQLHSLVHPTRPLPPGIETLTGLTDDDLKDAPEIDDLVGQIWDFIQGSTLVGHNVSFDIGFLKKLFAKKGYEGRFNYVDTLYLARLAYPDFPNHKLETLIKKLGLSDSQTHRALDDVICTQKLLQLCLPILLEKKEKELAERRAAKKEAESMN